MSVQTMDFAALEELAREAAKGREIVYFQSRGNAGDCLIGLGGHQLLRRAGAVGYRARNALPPQFDVKGKLLIYGGGGNFVDPVYFHCRTVLKALHRDAGRVILMPHTVKGNEDLLAEFGDNVDIIARDRRSYDHIAAHMTGGGRAHLAHDLAFGIDMQDAMHGPLRLQWPTAKEAAKLVRHRLRRAALEKDLPRGPVLTAMRVDVEATGIEIPEGNVDLSERLGGTGSTPEMMSRIVSRDFLRVLDRYEEIRTNRLHVAVGALLLGKKVTLHDNNYGKIRAIYEHSMKARFGHLLTWMGGGPEGAVEGWAAGETQEGAQEG